MLVLCAEVVVAYVLAVVFPVVVVVDVLVVFSWPLVVPFVWLLRPPS